MKNIPFQKLALATALGVLCAAPLTANALGFGPLRLKSGIGQPLLAEVDVAVQPKEGDDLDIQGASPAEYERQGLAPHPALSTLTVVVERRAGKLVAVMRTKTPITEPYSQIILEGKVGSSRVSRSYVALLKPTALKESMASAASATSSRFTDNTASRPGAPALVSAAIDRAEAVEKPARLARERAELMLARIPKNWDEKKGAYQDEATRRYASIIEVGSRPVAEELYRVKGYGKQQSVGKVLSQVVPPGWHGYAGQVNVSDLKPVDWTGGNSYWLLLLDEILAERDLTATVDWSKKEVTFRSANGVPGAKVLQAAAPAAPVAPMTPVAPAVPAAPVAAAVAQAPVALPPVSSKAPVAPPAPVVTPLVAQAPAPAAVPAPVVPSAAALAQQARADAQVAAAERSKRIAEVQAQVQATQAAQAAQVAQAAQAAQTAQAAKEAQAAKSVKLTRVNVSSRKGAPASLVRSSGYNVTLVDAVRQISPAGWAVFSEDVSAVSAEDVSWKGASRDWLVVMEEILAQRNLKANVDTDRREIALVRFR